MGESYSKDNWKPDGDYAVCSNCQRPFTFSLRRHHCRNCGDIFCSNCSHRKIALPSRKIDTPVRVCDSCYYVIVRDSSATSVVTAKRIEKQQSSPNTRAPANNSSSQMHDEAQPVFVSSQQPRETTEFERIVQKVSYADVNLFHINPVTEEISDTSLQVLFTPGEEEATGIVCPFPEEATGEGAADEGCLARVMRPSSIIKKEVNGIPLAAAVKACSGNVAKPLSHPFSALV